MGQEIQGADRREALRQAWLEIMVIEADYGLVHGLPRPVVPKRQHHWWLTIFTLCWTALVIYAIVLAW